MKRKRRPKHTREFVAAFFQTQGCKLLEPTYEGCKQQLRYHCKCGSIQYTCFNNFSRGFKCRKCFLKRFEKNKKKKLLRLKLRNQGYTINDVATILGVPYSDVWRAVRYQKTLPAPKFQVGIRKYYTEKDIEKIKSLVTLA